MIDLVIFLLLLISLIWGLVEYHCLAIRDLDVMDFDPKHEVPEQLKGQKIVFLSDLQFDHKFSGFQHMAMRRVVKKTNALKPDLILFGGDLIHKMNPHNRNIENYIKELNAPIIAILGNHDYYEIDYVLELYKKLEITLLVNESIDYCGMQIIGVDDLRIGKPVLPEVKDQFTLLLTHSADFVEIMDRSVDMALAGHFHGGMVTLFGLYAPVIKSAYGKKYQYGMIQGPTTKIFVGKGIGGYVFFIPMRFFARPEIITIQF